MDINQIILYSVTILACNPTVVAFEAAATMAGYTDQGATELFKQCLHAKTHVDRVKCETEYLQYRDKLEDMKHSKKEQPPKEAI
jgi:hypothetical protein